MKRKTSRENHVIQVTVGLMFTTQPEGRQRDTVSLPTKKAKFPQQTNDLSGYDIFLILFC